MRRNFLKTFCLIVFCSLLSSCYYFQTLKEEDRIRRVAKLYTKDAHYLLKDSVYKTVEERQKFEELKEKFLKTWLDSGNCHIHFIPNGEREAKWNNKTIREINVVNILHTPNYDTLLVLVTWLLGHNGSYETHTKGISILNINGQWKYDCKGTYNISIQGNAMEQFSLDIRRLMVKANYLTEDKKQDLTFFYRVYNDNDIWFKDWDVDPQEE
ncbi:MAG: hypothetical protein V4642_02615 [Bacteroidota bacterium]